MIWFTSLGCTPAEPLHEDPPPSVVEVPRSTEASPLPRPTPSGRIVPAAELPGSVEPTMRRYGGQVKWCYEQQLTGDPTLAGRIELRWEVGPRGRPDAIDVVSDTTGRPELAACITRKLRRWRFPDPIRGEVTWPFVFRPTAGER